MDPMLPEDEHMARFREVKAAIEGLRAAVMSAQGRGLRVMFNVEDLHRYIQGWGLSPKREREIMTTIEYPPDAQAEDCF